MPPVVFDVMEPAAARARNVLAGMLCEQMKGARQRGGRNRTCH